MFNLNQLPDAKLLQLIDTKKLARLKEDDEQLYADLMPLICTELKRHPRQSLLYSTILPALKKGVAYPIYIWGTLAGVVSLGFLTLTVVTGGIATLALILGGFFSYAAYTKHKAESIKHEKSLQLVVLKNLCADELLKRHPAFTTCDPLPKRSIKQPETLPAVKTGITSALNISIILLESYYLGSYAIVAGMGFSAAAAITGPIGLAIAASIVVSISLFFAYKEYQAHKQKQYEDSVEKKLNKELNDKVDRCYKIKEVEKQSQPIVDAVLKDQTVLNTKASLPLTSSPVSVLRANALGCANTLFGQNLKPQPHEPPIAVSSSLSLSD